MMTTENNVNYKIAVIGNELLCLGFKLLGTKNTFNPQENLEEILKELIQNEEIGLIIINQKMVEKITNNKLLESMNKSIKPLIIEIQGYNEQDKHQDNLRKIILKAIGMDIVL